MERNRVFRREDFSDQINLESLLEDLNIEVVSETDYAFQIMCPYHFNSHSPAATVAKSNGFLFCYSGECEKRFSLIETVQDLKSMNIFQAKRFIANYKGEPLDIEDALADIAKEDEMPDFPERLLERFQNELRESVLANDYLESRHLLPKTIKAFGIGYDAASRMVVTPMRSSDDKLVGIIGRSIIEKRFKNSTDLPSSKTLFNINMAKRANSDSVILVESNFDALRVHQSGFANVVATLGGSFSKYHLSQLSMYFNTVILGVDNDEAGQKFAAKIARECAKVGLSVQQAKYSEAELFPGEAKDFGDCTDKEIAHMVRNCDIFGV